MAKKQECILLARVSTETQTTDPQIDDLKRFATSYGFNIFHIIQTTESGFKVFESKDGFSQVIEIISKHPNCKTVFATEISRIARNQVVLQQIKEWFIQNKVQLYIKEPLCKLLNENGSLDTTADLIFSIFSSIASSEMDAKKLRWKRAKRSLQAAGYSHCGKVLFGYTKEFDEEKGKNKLAINKEQAKQINDVLNHYISSKLGIKDLTLYAIQKGYDKYLTSKRNMNKLLKEQAYIGFKTTNNKYKNPEYWRYGDKSKDKFRYVHTEIRYPRIISQELFDKVQQKLSLNNTSSDKDKKHNSILSKIIICPCCGKYLGGTYRIRDNKLVASYRCLSRNTINNCDDRNKQYSMFVFDSVVWNFIKIFGGNIIQIWEKEKDNIDIKTVKQEINNLKQHLVSINEDRKIEENIYRRNKRLSNAYDDFIKAMDKLDKEENNTLRLISRNETILKEKSNNNSFPLEKIQSIEKNKLEIRETIRKFVDKIHILYSDKRNIILSLITNNLISNSTTVYYCIIDKHNTNKIRYSYIKQTTNYHWDNDTKSLNISGYNMTLEEYNRTIYDNPLEEQETPSKQEIYDYMENKYKDMNLLYINDEMFENTINSNNNIITYLKEKGVIIKEGLELRIESNILQRLNVYNDD